MAFFRAADDEPEELEIPQGVAAVLRDQTIDANGPGTILSDFATLLDFVGEEGLRTTGKYYQLPQAKLAELNQLMSHPLAHHLKRPQLRSFPHLMGLNVILRATGLGAGVGAPPKGRLVIRSEMLAAWQELNSTEQYFTLLDHWLRDGSPAIIGERAGGFMGASRGAIMDVFSTHRMLPTGRGEVGYFGRSGLMTLALMELFGWMRLDYSEPKPGKAAEASTFERTQFGAAVIGALMIWYRNRLFSDTRDDEESGPQLQPLLQPFFPEWRRTLSQPETPLREGTFTWRVSLGRVWRRIVAPDTLDLDTLAATILAAFEFDRDHLYCFHLREARGQPLRIACPYEDDAEAFTDEITLSELPLPVGSAMTFLFDYGDSWRFKVKLEAVGPPDPAVAGAEVTAEHGEPPPQYDYADEDGDDSWDDDDA